MSHTCFQFDARQPYQLDAIQAVVDLFDGQPKDIDGLRATLRGRVTPSPQTHFEVNESHTPYGPIQGQLAVDIAQEIGAIGNRLALGHDTILENLQKVQDRNGQEVGDVLANGTLDFDIEMETGTGKTYVYLRTIFELAQRYGFNKFIILVPSVAIREGVRTSIRLMRGHFRELYPSHPFDASVYSGERAEEVQAFATATTVQILVMTIDAIRGDKNTKIIHQHRDKLNGLRPLDYLKATRPIVIMDEPQNMESLLAQSAVSELAPLCTLRYSATHRQQRNLLYRLDPVDAHDLGLVKQIVVSEVAQQGADAAPYVKLLGVTNTRGTFKAKLELACRKADGSLVRKAKSIKPHQSLTDLTGNPAYEGWRINEMRIADGIALSSIELTRHGVLREGEAIGGATGALYREMIRETVREHLRKEAMLRANPETRGVKVLSLFFVDKVASYLGDGDSNDTANGDFARAFDEIFTEERNAHAACRAWLPQAPSELRRAYFSQIKKGGKIGFKDSSGATKADDDAYELIMRDKTRLLDADEPVRFIFSHSALREGWDNPNVFQICTLREMGAETERRQTLGRGLRLPVAKTAQGYVRLADRGIATLTVIANESYTAFAQKLQTEYQQAGVTIGRVRPNEFAKLPRRDAGGKATDNLCGYQWSKAVFERLERTGFLENGQATASFLPDNEGFSLYLPEALQPYETDIIRLIRHASIEHYVKPKSKRQSRRLNKELYATPEFMAFWNAISQKTTYRVQVRRDELITNVVAAIKNAPPIPPLRIEVTQAKVTVRRGGAQGLQLNSPRIAELKGSYGLPDIVGELQQVTSLTRQTLVDILIGSDRLNEFIANPNDFLALALRCVRSELAKLLIEGIQYEKIGGSIYELRELQSDGMVEKDFFLNHLYAVQHPEKTDFDHVVYDGGPNSPERQFAEFLDNHQDIKLFMKLPARFKVPTPVGDYNPDWAIIKQIAGEDRIYMIRETKSSLDDDALRPSELAKIKAAEAHFKAIGITNYKRSAPELWNI